MVGIRPVEEFFQPENEELLQAGGAERQRDRALLTCCRRLLREAGEEASGGPGEAFLQGWSLDLESDIGGVLLESNAIRSGGRIDGDPGRAGHASRLRQMNRRQSEIGHDPPMRQSFCPDPTLWMRKGGR